MVINIGKLEKGLQTEADLSEELILPEDYRYGDKNPIVKLKCTVSNVNGKYILKGIADTVITLQCNRCLTEFEKALSFEVNEVFVRGEASQEDEEHSFEGSAIVLDEVLISDIILNIPMKAVCKDDCKGLCYKCGQNLNISECGCDRTYVNPYFEDIKSFL